MATRQEPGSLPIGSAVNGHTARLGPALMLVARPAFALLAQATVAGILRRRGRSAPWREAGGWWLADGSLVDLGCLAALGWLARREGTRLAALPGARRDMLQRDLRQLLGDLAWLAPAFIASGLVQRRFYPHDYP